MYNISLRVLNTFFLLMLRFKKPSSNIKKWRHIDFSFDPSKSALYSVLVNEVAIKDCLFALQDIGDEPRWKTNPKIDLQWSPSPTQSKSTCTF